MEAKGETPISTNPISISRLRIHDIHSQLSPLTSDDEPQFLCSPASSKVDVAAKATSSSGSHSGSVPKPFNYLSDIVNNPELAYAARAEADGVMPSPPRGAKGSSYDPPPPPLLHISEIDRQTAALQDLDEDTVEESKINVGIAQVMLQRLHSGKTACEKVLGVLAGVSSAEATSARAILSAAKVHLAGSCDGPSLFQAATEFSKLPECIGSERMALAASLNEAVAPLQSLATDVRRASEEITIGTNSAQKAVDTARKALRSALLAHREACRLYDEATAKAGGRTPRGGLSSVDSDPWLSEGRLVFEQFALQRAQHDQRGYLASAFNRVGDLECRRVKVEKLALKVFIDAYRGGTHEVGYLEALVDLINCDTDLDEFRSIAARSIKLADSLSLRQLEALEKLSRDLASSPEIMKQGLMELWDTHQGRWHPVRCVLTRAGFLHWMPPPIVGDGEKMGRVQGSINLGKSSFEGGEAPIFKIVQRGGGLLFGGGTTKSLTLRASTVDESMQWAVDIKETITAGR